MNRPRRSQAQPADLGPSVSRWRRRPEIGDAAFCFVVYRLPRDFNGYVVRAFAVEPEGITPLDHVTAGSLDQCRKFIPAEASKCLARASDDVSAIFETWS